MNDLKGLGGSVRCLGDFKLYFVDKCLRSRLPNVHVRTVVGTNLRLDRESDAFANLFATKLSSQLARGDVDMLLTGVSTEVKKNLTYNMDHALAAVLDDDVVEHSCCEWVKAKRVRHKLCDSVLLIRKRCAYAKQAIDISLLYPSLCC